MSPEEIRERTFEFAVAMYQLIKPLLKALTFLKRILPDFRPSEVNVLLDEAGQLTRIFCRDVQNRTREPTETTSK